MIRPRETTERHSRLSSAAALALLLGVTAAHAQDAAEEASAEAPVNRVPMDDTLEEIRSVLDAETPAAEPAVSADDDGADSDDAYADDEVLEEIELRDDRLFENDVYFSGDEAIFDPEAPQETGEERLRRLFVLYMDAVSDRQFDEADGLAKQIVELTIQVYGLDSHESASALTNLAIAQHGIEDYESAILNYEASIGIIERVEDRLNGGLINPLRGLGAAQLASGRPDLARDSYNRAIHISHVNNGPHNLDQVETLQSLAETFLSVGELNDAIDVQKRIYYLQARNIDAKSIEIIPALQTRARWQRRVQLYEQERYTWRRIVSIIEDHKGKKSLDLIAPLTELGNSFLYVGTVDGTYTQPVSVTSGEIYLKRAVRIAEENPEANWETVSETMLQLGDYYLLSDRANRAHRVYRDVWKLLSEDPQQRQARARRLENVVLLHDIDPPRMYGGDPEIPMAGELPGFETGSAVFEYSVSTRGRSTNIKLVETDPPGLDDMYQTVGRQMRRLVHRPRHIDGVAVQTDKVRYSHSFYYRPADLPDDAPGDDEAEATSAGTETP